jgi:hypothetical protein
VNLTPHDPLVLFTSTGERVALRRPADAVRLQETQQSAGSITIEEGAIPLVTQEYGSATGLPPPQSGVWLLVSQLVVQAYASRSDLVFPVDLVRDATDTVIGCRAVARPNLTEG